MPPTVSTLCLGADGGLAQTSTSHRTVTATLAPSTAPNVALNRVKKFWTRLDLETRESHRNSPVPALCTTFDGGFYVELLIGTQTGKLSLSGSTPCLPITSARELITALD